MLIIGIGLGIAGFNLLPKDENQVIRADESNYKFIDPLLDCENATVHRLADLSDLHTKIDNQIDDLTKKGAISFAAVYYRDLNKGPWMSINEDTKFSPASLIKVPMLMAYYKLAESDDALLSKVITITDPISYEDQNFLPENKLVQGNSYTIQDLINRTIMYSDNVAYDVLLKNIDNAQILKVYHDLGINIDKRMKEDPNGDILSVKEYATFFRVLFNASYLSREKSEQALSLLTQTNFKYGIVDGLPQGTIVAHKFGERYYTFSGIRQLHDCGIVYDPQHPYLLCIMTRGTDFNQLSSAIQDLTKTVNEYHTSSPVENEN